MGLTEPVRHAVLVLAASPGSAARARRFTKDSLRGMRGVLPMDDLLLVVSELVTNAVRYGRGAPTLSLHAGHDWVRVEVTDNGELLPRGASPSDEERGRGLHLVDALTRKWGIEERTRGKTIWAELAAGAQLVLDREHAGHPGQGEKLAHGSAGLPQNERILGG